MQGLQQGHPGPSAPNDPAAALIVQSSKGPQSGTTKKRSLPASSGLQGSGECTRCNSYKRSTSMGEAEASAVDITCHIICNVRKSAKQILTHAYFPHERCILGCARSKCQGKCRAALTVSLPTIKAGGATKRQSSVHDKLLLVDSQLVLRMVRVFWTAEVKGCACIEQRWLLLYLCEGASVTNSNPV